MTRDDALRVDGMLRGALGNLDTIAHYLKDNFSPEESSSSIRTIGAAMAEVAELSSRLHAAFPDIGPDDQKS